MLQKTPHTQVSFNYDIVAEPVAVEAREAAQRIRLRLRRSAEDIIEIGRDLLTIKASIGHGYFLPWIEAEFGMSQSAAYKFMNVAKVYGDKVVTVTSMDPSALYELAAPKTPLEVREEVEKMIEAGEVVTKAEVARLKAEFEAAKRGKDLAEQDAEEAEKRFAEAQSSYEEELKARVNSLSNENVESANIIKALRAEIANMKAMASGAVDESPNVVRGTFAIPDLDDEDDFTDVERAINAFAGALGSMEGLEFSPTAFWEKQGKRGTHGKRLHQALLSVNATIGLLIKEYAK